MNKKSNIIVAEKINIPDINLITSSDSKDVIDTFLSDESKIITGNPLNVDKVFYPKTTEEVASIFKTASEQKIKVTVSGAGTGLTGGRVSYGGWIIATDQLREVKKYENEQLIEFKDPVSNHTFKVSLIENESNSPHIRVPPGIPLRTIQEFVKSLGYFYPPDATEWSSFIGGNVATNASGARTFKYGSTRVYVDQLVVVLSTGSVLYLDRDQITDESFSWEIKQKNDQFFKVKVDKTAIVVPQVSKNAVGFPIYDKMPLIELFIGTEGIFGTITEITLKLIPFPKNIFSIISYFQTAEQASHFVKMAQEQKKNSSEPIPMSLEFFDFYALELVKKNQYKIPDTTIAAVYLEQDVDDEKKIDQYLEFWLEKLESIGYIDSWAEIDDKGIEKHKEFRHSLPVGVHNIIKKYKVSKVGTDFAVPQEVFSEFFDLLKNTGQIFVNYQNSTKPLTNDDISFVIYGHIGNNHLHMNFLPRNQQELHRAEELYLDMAKEVVNLGGTISAEHGVGKKKYGGKSYIWYMIGDIGISALKQIKLILDPANILNRGNLFD
jgi:D-lactate dehydrogenase (cytochrome)